MTTFNSLLVGGATGWHSGGDSITYSYLGALIPDYYDRVDTDGDGVDDRIRVLDGDPSDDLPIGTNASMTLAERALVEQAVAAWNEVANINLVPGSIDDGPETGAPVTGNGSLVGGLGGAAGFGEIEVARNDDGSSFYEISSVFPDGLNFFGNTYSDIWVNTNGNISFGGSIGTFTPFQISGGSTPIIAPFWADVDTRQDDDPASPDSAPIYVDMDTGNGVLTITWSAVGYYFQNAETTNSFQLQLFDRGGGDFDIVFRYADVSWTTGDASGGSGGLGGTPARAGYSAGNGADFFELAQSGNQAAMLGLDGALGNTGQQGLHVFQVRNGGTIGDITFGAADFTGDPNTFGFVSGFEGELGTRSAHGDLWINRAMPLQNEAAYGNTGWQTYLHELGHALGLRHPDQDPNNEAGDPRNNNQYTVMSYEAHPGQAGLPAGDSAWPITPMVFDIQAIQRLYGANLSTRNGDNTYFGTAPAGSEIAYGLADGGLLSNGRVAILTVWDAGGTDTFSAANQTAAVTLNLNPGSYSTIGAIANNIGLAAAVREEGVIVNLIENALGGAGDDRLVGNLTANVLDGGAGADTMRGGDGNDVFMVDNVDDEAIELFDSGNDLVNSSVSFVLDAHVERLVLTGTAANGSGNGIRNAITGNAAANILNGGGEADVLRGETGDDTYIVDEIGDRVLEAADAGLDLVRSSASFRLGNHIENLTLIGTEAINATGNGLANLIVGNAARNRLDGAGNADTMRGGRGNDTYMVDGADAVIELARAGLDTVRSLVNFRLGNNVENLILIGAAVEAIGNSLGNALSGTDGANLLDGKAGADTMRGGDGDDVYRVDGSGDEVLEGADGGIDEVRSTANFTLGDHVETLVLLDDAVRGTGNSLANDISGNATANILDGAGGADTMRGGDGDDLYVVGQAGDRLVEGNGAGIDLVRSTINFRLRANVEDLILVGPAVRGTGNGLANGILGTDGANLLEGGGGADSLNGGAGADRLFGGAGNDDLRGGVGADRYVFDAALDEATNVDDLLGFSVADDTIVLDRTIFADIGANGVLSRGAFRAGSAAEDPSDRIVYNEATGEIFYDADGDGAGVALLFARVADGTELSRADFNIVA